MSLSLGSQVVFWGKAGDCYGGGGGGVCGRVKMVKISACLGQCVGEIRRCVYLYIYTQKMLSQRTRSETCTPNKDKITGLCAAPCSHPTYVWVITCMICLLCIAMISEKFLFSPAL